MQRVTILSSLCALISGLLLAACGGAPEAGLAPAQEAVGTREAELCSGLSVTTLAISGISTYQGEMAGSGDWAVSPGANAVRLEYYIDGVLQSYEERVGTSGTWYFSQGGVSCGTHTFLVKAFPMVIDSQGNRTTCLSSYLTASQPVTEDCPPPPSASLSCTRTSTTTIRCIGSASGGTGSLTPFWQEVWDGYGYGWWEGAWTEYFYCDPGTALAEPPLSAMQVEPSLILPPGEGTVPMRIQFKVRDSLGLESTVRSSIYYYCIPY